MAQTVDGLARLNVRGLVELGRLMIEKQSGSRPAAGVER